MCFIPRRPPTSMIVETRWKRFKRAPIRKTTKSPSISAAMRRPAIFAISSSRVQPQHKAQLASGPDRCALYIAILERTQAGYVISGHGEQQVTREIGASEVAGQERGAARLRPGEKPG